MTKPTEDNPFYNRIKAGLEEAIAFAEGNTDNVRIHHVPLPQINVKTARKKLGLSQDKFAVCFGIPASTLRNWEQGRRTPEGAARLLLAVIDKYPNIVMDVLHNNN